MGFIAKKIIFHISKLLSFGVLATLSFLIASLFQGSGDNNNSAQKSYILLSGDQLFNFISTPIAHADAPGDASPGDASPGDASPGDASPGDSSDCDADADSDGC